QKSAPAHGMGRPHRNRTGQDQPSHSQRTTRYEGTRHRPHGHTWGLFCWSGTDGLYMGFLWALYGLSMGYTWALYGLLWAIH
ncbi:hypothetical protein SARC_17421, partial [Sphaeroforma arctica JP610]